MVKFSNRFDEALWGEKNSVHAKIIEPRFAVKDFDVKPQYINHWRKQDLFFKGSKTDGRKLFSFADYVWIRMIEKMKDVGLRFEVIRQVRDHLEVKPLWLEKADESYKIIIERAKRNGVEKDKIEELDIKRRTSYELGSLMTYFTNQLAGVIARRKELSYLINPDGEVLHLVNDDAEALYKKQKFIENFKSFYFSISVTDIVRKFIDSDKRQIATENLHLITKEEETVLKHLEGGELVKLMIEVEGVLTDLFEGKSKSEKESNNIKQKYLNVITTQQYEQITFQNNRGTETKFLSPKQIKLLDEEEDAKGE